MTNGVLGVTNIASDLSIESLQKLSGLKDNITTQTSLIDTDETGSFASVLQNAMTNSLNNTQNLIDSAQEAEIQFALGNADNTHDLQIAQQKANLAVAYTVAVRDNLLDAYKEIMNMQI